MMSCTFELSAGVPPEDVVLARAPPAGIKVQVYRVFDIAFNCFVTDFRGMVFKHTSH